jgi:hypothetical protein
VQIGPESVPVSVFPPRVRSEKDFLAILPTPPLNSWFGDLAQIRAHFG